MTILERKRTTSEKKQNNNSSIPPNDDVRIDTYRPPQQRSVFQPTMAPLVEVWPASELPDRVQVVRSGFKDKRRKVPIDLEKCKLMEMVQYSCNPPSEPPPGPGVVHCKPIVRLFRRYIFFYSLYLFKGILLLIDFQVCAKGHGRDYSMGREEGRLYTEGNKMTKLGYHRL